MKSLLLVMVVNAYKKSFGVNQSHGVTLNKPKPASFIKKIGALILHTFFWQSRQTLKELSKFKLLNSKITFQTTFNLFKEVIKLFV